MIKGSRYVRSQRIKSRQETGSKKPRGHCSINLGGGAKGQYGRDLPPRGNSTHAVLQLEAEVQRGRNQLPALDEARSKSKRPRKISTGSRGKKTKVGTRRVVDRAPPSEKKRELGLHGDLRGRHLPHDIRAQLFKEVDAAVAMGEAFESVCRVLELNPRAV
jgi:hypothetical protein